MFLSFRLLSLNTGQSPVCQTYAKEKRCNLKKGLQRFLNSVQFCQKHLIRPLFRLAVFPLPLRSQSVCPYRSYHQGVRRAAAALCPLRRACLTGIGLRIYGNAVSAQRISVNPGAAPCSQCSQGSILQFLFLLGYVCKVLLANLNNS